METQLMLQQGLTVETSSVYCYFLILEISLLFCNKTVDEGIFVDTDLILQKYVYSKKKSHSEFGQAIVKQ